MILLVYIRDVYPANHKKVLKIAEEIGKLGVEMMLVTDTIQAAQHAVFKGWILEGDIAEIAEEKKENEKSVTIAKHFP